eukprot:COSAG03_NODE_23112_length_283_cov_0.836957_1_plen_37_part_10
MFSRRMGSRRLRSGLNPILDSQLLNELSGRVGRFVRA